MAEAENDDERSRWRKPDGGTTEPFDGEDYVRWAYRLLLGREPESLETVENNPFKDDRKRLVRSVLDSDEFRNSNSFLWVPTPQSGLTAEFDIDGLRQRDKRWDNVAELRHRASAVPMGNGMDIFAGCSESTGSTSVKTISGSAHTSFWMDFSNTR